MHMVMHPGTLMHPGTQMYGGGLPPQTPLSSDFNLYAHAGGMMLPGMSAGLVGAGMLAAASDAGGGSGLLAGSAAHQLHSPMAPLSGNVAPSCCES
jgi:hypothetical protein